MDVKNKNIVFYPKTTDSVDSSPCLMEGNEAQQIFKFAMSNITEYPGFFKIEVVLPGYEMREINLEIWNEEIRVYGQKKERVGVSDAQLLQQEFQLNDFYRSFTLPDTVDIDSVEASYELGILSIRLPKLKLAMVRITDSLIN